MNNVVEGRVLRVGDRVKVINATIGAYGANGHTGVVVREIPIGAKLSGLGRRDGALLIKLDRPSGFCGGVYWGVSKDGLYELLSTPKRRKHIEIDAIIKGDETRIVVNDKVGVSRCKAEDSFNEAYGIILAVASAYGLSREKREAIVDALYDDVKTLKDYNATELTNEVKRRMLF